MGVIQRQGTKNSVISMIGVLIGAFATLFIYPHALEAYGLARFLIDSSIVLAPIMILGIHALPIKFFPTLEDKASIHHGFFSFMLLLALSIIIITSFFFYFFRDFIVGRLLMIDENNSFLIDNTKYLLPLGVLSGLALVITNYINVFKRIAIPAIFNNLFLKIGTALLIFLVVKNVVDISQVGSVIVFIYALTLGGLLFYLAGLGEMKISRIKMQRFSALRNQMIDFAFFSILGGVGYLVAFKIDSIMVTTLVGESENGAYNIGLFIGASISIPVAAITSISAPLISGWWKEKDTSRINDLYKKSSINLLVIGIGLFVLILTSLNDLLDLLPKQKEFNHLYDIVLYLGAARIIDMALGVKHQIIMYSNHYRFALYTVVTLAIMNVLTNLFFIKILGLGMRGAAIATFISFFMVNLIYFIFIFTKFKMQPFSIKTVKIAFIGMIIYLLGLMIQPSLHPAFNLVLRSLILIVPYVLLVYVLKLSSEINVVIKDTSMKIRGLLKP